MKRRQYRRAVMPALALCLAAAAAMLVSPGASGQGGRRGDRELERVLRGFDRLSLDPAELLRGARSGGRVTLRTSRGAFDLDVEPFDIRGENYRAVAAGPGGVMTELPRTPSHAWRGTVAGAKGTFVRLVLDGESVEGIIITPSETFFVEPAGNLTTDAGADEFVFYAESSVTAEGGECATDTLAGKVAARAAGARLAPNATTTRPTPEEIFAPKPEAEVATEADFEFFQLNGNNAANTNADINSIMTQVDAIYDRDLGMKLRVVFQRVWAVAGDPYTTANASKALEQLTNVYDTSFPGGPPARDLTHMFTGKTLLDDKNEPGIVGIAWPAVVCDIPEASYGISQSRFTNLGNLRVTLTAHEIGHNFGATHPNEDKPVPAGCSPSIMNSFVQNTQNFCQYSRDQITSHVTGSGGDCLGRLTQPGCEYSISPTSNFYTVSGGAGVVDVTATAGCVWGVAEGAPWVVFTGPEAGTGSGVTSYTVAPNNGKDGPRRAFVDIGGRRLAISQQTSPACLASAAPIAMGQLVNGTLAPTDCIAAQPSRLNAYEDLYTFAARAGQRVRVEMTTTGSPAIDTYLYLFGPDGSIVAENDDIVRGVNTNSRIPAESGQFFTLPQTGVYTIAATTFENASAGAYSLRLSDNSGASSVTFSAAAYGVNESTNGGLGTDGAGMRVITVTRGGDATGTATVNYATSDGTAVRRTDYIQALGTLVFGPGETLKTFNVFVEDDAFAEESETVQLTLSNPVGTSLGANAAATLTIGSNEASDGPSPVRAESFDTAFFVRQQYLDFFSREPDAEGFAFWQNDINQCGADPVCREVKRINVSAAFFVSIEFQETGYLVYRVHKAAFGDATSPNVEGTVPVIRLTDFLADTRRIGEGVVVNRGEWAAQLEANKQAFALEFVLRPGFVGAFPLAMAPEQFVDKLNQNAGGVLSQGERDALVAQLANAVNPTAARASVLRQVAEHEALKAAEFRRAFVLMQYFGYLRRNPDEAPEPGFNYAGWKFWLGKLNEFNGNYVQAEMVKAFLDSGEYRNRFGQ